MQYVSTRGQSGRKQFCEIVLEGLAADRGLYVPESYPRVDQATLDAWRTLFDTSLSFEIPSLYLRYVPPADLKAILEIYTPAVFGTPEVAPLRKLESRLYLQEMSNGPTLACKETVCLNAWCVDSLTRRHDEERAAAVLGAYESAPRLAAMQRAAAFRFWLSSLWDVHLPRQAALLKPHYPSYFECILLMLRREFALS